MMKNSTGINEVSSFPHDSVEDFTCEPSIASESEIIMSAGGPLPLRANKPSLRSRVRISQFSQLFLIPYDDVKSKWYTQEEQNLFNRTRLSDALRLRNLLQGETCAEINEDVLCELVGLETFIFPHIARHVVQKKRAHREAVLVLAQKMHRGDDDDNMTEKLSESSKMSSRWARERAAKIAACYAPY